jgi:hypothetical protein
LNLDPAYPGKSGEPFVDHLFEFLKAAAYGAHQGPGFFV